MPAPDSRNGYARSDHSFPSDGTRCAAWVYRPAEPAAADLPVVVMAHGFGAVRELGLPPYAERFAAAGYVVVVFDYRTFGDSEGTPRQLLDVGRQLADWQAAVRFATGLPGVDPRRVIGWGTSFAGGHVLNLASRGIGFSAVIAQVPHVSGPAAVRATGIWHGLRIAPTGLRDQIRAWRGRSPVYIDSVGVRGAHAVMTSDDAVPGLARMIEASAVTADAYPQNVAARILLWIGLYSPGRRTRRITCPTLVQIGLKDAVTPPSVARRAAKRIKGGVVREYDCTHFEPYLPPIFDAVVAHQLEFLATHVPAGAGQHA